MAMLDHFSAKRSRYSNRAVIVIYSNRAFSKDYSNCSHYIGWFKSFTFMLIVFKNYFAKVPMSQLYGIDHAYHALAVTIKRIASTCHFKHIFSKFFLRENSPRLRGGSRSWQGEGHNQASGWGEPDNLILKTAVAAFLKQQIITS